MNIVSCFGQDWFDLERAADHAFLNRDYEKSIQLYDSLIPIVTLDTINSQNLRHYFYDRAQVKYHFKNYTGALTDINESLKREEELLETLRKVETFNEKQWRDYINGKHSLRGTIRLALNDREGACSDFKISNSRKELQIYCDDNWDYKKIHKVFCKDTAFVLSFIEAYYIGCKSKTIDTSYTLKTDLDKKGDWEIYYDKDFKVKMADCFTRNDTFYTILYYPSGQRKNEIRVLSISRLWIYNADWCENGQMTNYSNPNSDRYNSYISYYCNGNKSWQGNLWNGEAWGIETRWYENGMKKSERHYTDFNQDLATKGQLEKKEITSEFWDEKGNKVESLQDEYQQLINTIGAPLQISPEEFNGAISFYNCGIKGYDNKMEAFSEKVYSIAKLTSPTKCNVGQVYISFIVNKNGNITNIKAYQSLEESVDKAFIKAIESIGKWAPSDKYDIYVVVALELERIKK